MAPEPKPERKIDLFGEHSRIAFLTGVPEAAQLLMVRHGEAQSPGVHGMADNPPLSALGRAQAAAAARRIAAGGVHRIYSSPVRRARETADHLAALTDLPVTEVAGLSEVEWHPPDSMEPSLPVEAAIAAQRLAQFGRLRMLRWADFPGFETGSSLRARVVGAVDAIAAAHPGETVAIFAHFGVINAYLAHLFDAEPDVLFPLINSSISTVMAAGDDRGIRAINDYAHCVSGDAPPLWDGRPGLRS